jgi:uncharacterized protein (DUF433 family)
MESSTMATGTSPESRPRVSVEHIELDERGNAKLAGHRIKVKHLVAVMRAQGYTAEQLQAEAYPHLSFAQIYAALAYYYDHQAEIDRQIEEDDEFYEREWEKQQSDPKHQELVAKLRSRSKSRDDIQR